MLGEVLATHDRLTAWVPVPDRGSVSAELPALVTTVIFPLTLPAEIGAKLTVKLEVCPAAKVKGRESPPIVKPVPVTLTCEMVRLAVPEFLRGTGCLLLLPRFTVPKARLAGLAESRSVAPVPESDTVAGEFVALLTIEMLPG